MTGSSGLIRPCQAQSQPSPLQLNIPTSPSPVFSFQSHPFHSNQFSQTKPNPIRSDSVRSGPVRSDPVRSELIPVRSGPSPSDPVRSDPVKSDPVKSDPVWSCPIRSNPVDPIRSDTVRSGPIRSDLVWSDHFKVSSPIISSGPCAPPHHTNSKNFDAAFTRFETFISSSCQTPDFPILLVDVQLKIRLETLILTLVTNRKYQVRSNIDEIQPSPVQPIQISG